MLFSSSYLQIVALLTKCSFQTIQCMELCHGMDREAPRVIADTSEPIKSKKITSQFTGNQAENTVGSRFTIINDLGLSPRLKKDGITREYIANTPQLMEPHTGLARNKVKDPNSETGKKVLNNLMWMEFKLLRRNLVFLFNYPKILTKAYDLASIHEYLELYFKFKFSGFDIKSIFISNGKAMKNFPKDISILVDKLNLILKETNLFKPSDLTQEEIHLQRCVLQTADFMYQHELISTTEFLDLFQSGDIIEHSVQIMFNTYLMARSQTLSRIEFGLINGKNLLNSYFSSPFRNMVEVFQPGRKRYFSYLSLEKVFQVQIEHFGPQLIYNDKLNWKRLQELFFKGNQLFDLMEKYNLKLINMGEIGINNHAETERSNTDFKEFVEIEKDLQLLMQIFESLKEDPNSTRPSIIEKIQ
ncbi:hypothetical protein PGTUg99_013279 [Puccinia graminis f. sp. tritici]|uniref:Uncharacterized protein n=1 Tax=Puccinia graminis f. sp. tritici TaxID=56615 RepID=A0A5B0RRQ5_PUCGR|nr:hypothetical protein PGTUg99_013279 [Puccinia graminis f. sp. tritici]